MYGNIEAERKRARMSQRELSRRIGIAERTYRYYMAGGAIPSDKLLALAELFSCTTDYLLGRTAAAIAPGDRTAQG